MSSHLLAGSLAPSLKYLNAWLPVNKPAGFCCSKIAESIRLDIYYHFEKFANLRPGQVFVDIFQTIEHFAEGLVTYRIGNMKKENVSFKLCESIYETTIELGVEREFNSIDWRILNLSSAMHVTRGMIESATSNFIGFYEQNRTPFYHVNVNGGSGRNGESVIPDNLSAREYYDLMSFPHKAKCPKKVADRLSQKYPTVIPSRTIRIDEIKILDYEYPYLSLRIHTMNGFNTRQFSQSLAEKLGTKASVVKLKRIKEGPLELADDRVIQLHELSFDSYSSRMLNLKSVYRDFLDEMKPIAEEALH